MPDLFHPPPRPPKSYRPGQKHERATQTRDASYREHKASGKAATQRERLLRYYATSEPAMRERDLQGLTDKEAAALFARDGQGIPASTVSARRNELKAHEPVALVEKCESRKCCVTGNTATPWQITPAGREVFYSQEAA